jgi:hypothetical protein
MDIGVEMSPAVFEHKLECAHDGKSPEATWNTRRVPKELTPGWTNRLFVAVNGHWRGYFLLSGEVLWNPDDDVPCSLIFDTRRWTPIELVPAPRFRGWTYVVPTLEGESGMIPFERIWVEQCHAARIIREQHGVTKSMGYLIGEKLMNFVEAAETRSEFARELPAFVEEIKRMFSTSELEDYLGNLKRVGALGHILDDDQFEEFRAAKALMEDPVGGAEGVLRLERIKELLLRG